MTTKTPLANQFVQQTNNGSLFLNSKIINKIDEIDFIINELTKKKNNIKNINLIFRASEEGDNIGYFNLKCNQKINELIIIKTVQGYIFGGFTSVGWNLNKGKDIYDSEAFIFSFNLKKIYTVKNPQYALHCQSGDGRLSFGSTSFAFLLGYNFLSRPSCLTEKMIDYNGETQEREINGGQKYFQILELEVFQILT